MELVSFTVQEKSIERMLEHQDKLNISLVGKDWRDKASVVPSRAAWVECAELMGWCDWEWWKETKPNRDQQIIELVDIFHFILSGILKEEGLIMYIYDSYLSNGFKTVQSEPSSRLNIDYIEGLVLNLIWEDYEKILDNFFKLVAQLEIGEMLFEEIYFGKAILNQFRKDNGYQNGTYIKVWDGVEDNLHMLEILRLGQFDNLYELLQNRYNRLVKDSRREYAVLGSK